MNVRLRVLTHSLTHPDHEVDETNDDGRDWLHESPKLATRSRARVPFRTTCSNGETESAEEYKHLWGDAVYGAVDDTDDGDREATRNVRHANPLFLGGAGREFVAALPGTIEFR